MSCIFNGCNNLKEINISNFKIKKECKTLDVFKGINKIECKLLATDEIIQNLFNQKEDNQVEDNSDEDFDGDDEY